MKVVSAFVLAALVVSLTSCGGDGSASSGPGDDKTWIHGIIKPKGDAGYFLMAQERGYFEKQGVQVELKEFVGGVQLMQALVSGAIDSGDTALSQVYDATLNGADLNVVGSTLPKNTYAVYSKASIKNFDDLLGKTIGSSSPGAFPDEVVRAMLAAKDLDPKKLEVVNSGGDSQRIQALLNGRTDAAAGSVESIPKIKKNPDFRVLATVQDVIPHYPRFFITATSASLERKPDSAVRFLAAEMQGICYAVMHPKAEVSLTAKALNVSPSDTTVNYTQQVISKADAASPTSAIPMPSLEYLQRFRLSAGFQKKAIDLSELVDRSYRDNALLAAKLPKECRADPNDRT